MVSASVRSYGVDSNLMDFSFKLALEQIYLSETMQKSTIVKRWIKSAKVCRLLIWRIAYF